MPGRSPANGKKWVYLDWSTFGEAFEGFSLHANAGQRALSRACHTLSAETNLCFSFIHTWELSHLGDAGRRRALAQWLDDLNLVWVRTDNDVIKSEVVHAILDAVHGTRTAPPLPTAPSFLSMFDAMDTEAASYALKNPSLGNYVELLATEPRLTGSLSRFRTLSVESAKRFYDDRVAGLRQVTKDEMIEVLDQKLRASLAVDVRNAVEHLASNPSSGIHVLRNGMFVTPTADEVLAMLNGFPDFKALPYVFLSQRVTRSMSFEILGTAKKRRNFEKQRGDLYDIAHLVGAAYCDVFTCDTRVARRLERGRELIGFPPPIAGRPELVDRSIRQQLKL